MTWRSVATQAARPRGHEAVEKLSKAYLDVFGREDEATQLVLADLAEFCGFYKVAPPGTPAETLLYEQGLRAAFGRLFHFLSLPPERLKDLEEAARREALANEEEGII
ncbi:hypothetical protein [Nitratireductor basaltis]|uniref:Bbp19-like phage domain-containing protein n=1 Tax=Nitratireductor basaltis TaxID=472175 RepID=A0A084UDJ9_9HYPH|nr:hypothetical protein [Nitratireductor basaltis]KFB11035.1 hypothetical protein EL18_02077 [Nitratireductor basaltis]